MCLAVPAQIIERSDGERAVVDLAGSRLGISTLLTPQVRVGDWVLLHTGFAVQILEPEAAERLRGEMRAWQEGADADAEEWTSQEVAS